MNRYSKHYQVPLKYSQNLVKDPYLVETLIAKSDISSADIVVEIGAGKGIITKVLAQKASKVIAFEKDRNFVASLRQTLSNNVELKEQDFLNADLPKLKYKVFSNIPFSITSEIFNKILRSENLPESIYLFMEDAAARKFICEPFETQSSVLAKAFFEIKIVHKFQKDDFIPAPSVNVVLIEFKKKKSQIDFKQKDYYIDFVVYAFSQWKPTIRLALRKIFSNLQLKIIADELKFDTHLKPSELSAEKWLLLFKKYLQIVPTYKRNLTQGSSEDLKTNQRKMRKTNLNFIQKKGHRRHSFDK